MSLLSFFRRQRGLVGTNSRFKSSFLLCPLFRKKCYSINLWINLHVFNESFRKQMEVPPQKWENKTNMAESSARNDSNIQYTVTVVALVSRLVTTKIISDTATSSPTTVNNNLFRGFCGRQEVKWTTGGGSHEKLVVLSKQIKTIWKNKQLLGGDDVYWHFGDIWCNYHFIFHGGSYHLNYLVLLASTCWCPFHVLSWSGQCWSSSFKRSYVKNLILRTSFGPIFVMNNST